MKTGLEPEEFSVDIGAFVWSVAVVSCWVAGAIDAAVALLLLASKVKLTLTRRF